MEPLKASDLANQQAGKLVLIIGPSGVGKSVILKQLRERHPEFHIPRSATTRARREGESADLYHFVSDEAFNALIEDDKILEWAIVHSGARYGTMYDEIVPFVEHGKIVVREVDVQGFVSIQNHPIFKDGQHRLQSIFILPESEEQLIDHIRKRSEMSDDELKRRLESMHKELSYADHCTAKVINHEGKVEDAIAEVEDLIINQ